ncbi:hypothetical protein VTO73DRAFT_4579 [Trametes versicolor]
MAQPIRDVGSQDAPLPNNNPLAARFKLYYLHTHSLSAGSIQQTTLPRVIFPPDIEQDTPPGSDSAQDIHCELDDIRHLFGVSAYDTAFRGHDDSNTALRDDVRGIVPNQPGRGDDQARRPTAGTSQSKSIQ